MSEELETAPLETARPEIEVLKERAKLMGISHSGNIGVEALRKKIEDKLAGVSEEPAAPTITGKDEAAALNPLAGDVAGETPKAQKSKRQQLIDEATRLIRCRITNLDPKKKDLHGEIFAVGNDYIGVIRKFIPYGEVTDDGFHVPKIIFDEMDSRRFVHIKTTRDKRTGQIVVTTTDAKEFALEVLPQLTPDELAKLAAAQRAAGSVG